MTKHILSVKALIAALFVLGYLTTWAAKAPVSAGGLNQAATHIVSGTVFEVTAKTQRSKVETAPGIHLDRVFNIKLNVNTVSKGVGVYAGDQITFVAWQLVSRIPPMFGLQGHGPIPKKGDSVKVYLVSKGSNPFEPILPNGIVIEKEADSK